jgi:hypothetical protein
MAYRTWDQLSAKISGDSLSAMDAVVRQRLNMSLQELSDQCDLAGSPLSPQYLTALFATALPLGAAQPQRHSDLGPSA